MKFEKKMIIIIFRLIAQGKPISILHHLKASPLPIIKLFLSMSPWVLSVLWAPPVIPLFLYSKIWVLTKLHSEELL